MAKLMKPDGYFDRLTRFVERQPKHKRPPIDLNAIGKALMMLGLLLTLLVTVPILVVIISIAHR